MTTLCADLKCGKLPGESGYCEAHAPPTEVDSLHGQVRTLTAERDELAVRLAGSEERARMLLNAKNEIADSLRARVVRPARG